MGDIFAECRRVMKDDGLLTMMFTHKTQAAWETLTRALIENGWIISSSFPVDSEASVSMHQKDQAAAASSIFLACRKRDMADRLPAAWRGFGGTGVQTYLKKQPEDMPVRLEAGTMNAHGLAGLSAAVDFINEAGVEEIHRHEMELMQLFYKEVKEIDGVTVYGDFSGDRGAIVTINIRDYDSSEVSDCLMQDYEIATRPGAHCAPLMHEALGTTDQGAVRFSFSWFNTKDEVLDAIKAVRELSV